MDKKLLNEICRQLQSCYPMWGEWSVWEEIDDYFDEKYDYHEVHIGLKNYHWNYGRNLQNSLYYTVRPTDDGGDIWVRCDDSFANYDDEIWEVIEEILKSFNIEVGMYAGQDVENSLIKIEIL